MTSKNRSKDLARRLQATGDLTYQQARQQLVAWDSRSADHAAALVQAHELAHWARQALDDSSRLHVQVHEPAMGVHAATVTDPDSGWHLELSDLAVHGFTWRDPDGNPVWMAAFNVDGDDPDGHVDLQRWERDPAARAKVADAVGWLTARFAASPSGGPGPVPDNVALDPVVHEPDGAYTLAQRLLADRVLLRRSPTSDRYVLFSRPIRTVVARTDDRTVAEDTVAMLAGDDRDQAARLLHRLDQTGTTAAPADDGRAFGDWGTETVDVLEHTGAGVEPAWRRLRRDQLFGV